MFNNFGRVLGVTLVSAAVLLGSTTQASAAPRAEVRVPAVSQSSNVDFASLKVGQSLSVGGVTVTRDATGLSVTEFKGQSARGWCASSITPIVFAMGAAALLAAAAAGGITVAGFFLNPAALTALAGIAGTYSALYAYIDSKICK